MDEGNKPSHPAHAYFSNIEFRNELLLPSLAKPIRINIEDFVKKENLGAGSFGVVQKWVYKPLNLKMAVKSIPLPARRKMQRFTLREHISKINDIKNEAQILHSLQFSDYVIRMYGFALGQDYAFILMEAMAFSFQDVIEMIKYIPYSSNYFNIFGELVITGMLNALEACNTIQVQHSDVKPSNVLLGWNAEVKLCDFGLAIKFDDDVSNSRLGTLLYCHPEYFRQPKKALDSAVSDLWALGLMMWEFYLTTHPIEEIARKKVKELAEIQDVLSNLTLKRIKEEGMQGVAYVTIVKFIERCLNAYEESVDWQEIRKTLEGDQDHKRILSNIKSRYRYEISEQIIKNLRASSEYHKVDQYININGQKFYDLPHYDVINLNLEDYYFFEFVIYITHKPTGLPFLLECIEIGRESNGELSILDISRRLQCYRDLKECKQFLSFYGWKIFKGDISSQQALGCFEAMDLPLYDFIKFVRYQDSIDREEALSYIAFNLITALHKLEEKGYVYRGLDTARISIQKDGMIKLNPTGFIKHIDRAFGGGDPRKRFIQFVKSVAIPEIKIYQREQPFHRQKNYYCYFSKDVEDKKPPSFKDHIWNLGMVLFDVANENPLKLLSLEEEEEEEERKSLLEKSLAMSGFLVGVDKYIEQSLKNIDLSYEWKSLIMACIQEDSSQRPSVKDLMENPLFIRLKNSPSFIDSAKGKAIQVYEKIMNQAKIVFNIDRLLSVNTDRHYLNIGSGKIDYPHSTQWDSSDDLVRRLMIIDENMSTDDHKDLQISLPLRSHICHTLLKDEEFFSRFELAISQSPTTEEEQLELAEDKRNEKDQNLVIKDFVSSSDTNIMDMTEDEQLELAIQLSLLNNQSSIENSIENSTNTPLPSKNDNEMENSISKLSWEQITFPDNISEPIEIKPKYNNWEWIDWDDNRSNNFQLNKNLLRFPELKKIFVFENNDTKFLSYEEVHIFELVLHVVHTWSEIPMIMERIESNSYDYNAMEKRLKCYFDLKECPQMLKFYGWTSYDAGQMDLPYALNETMDLPLYDYISFTTYSNTCQIEDALLYFIYNLLNALNELEKRGYVYRGLDTQRISIQKDGSIKLSPSGFIEHVDGQSGGDSRKRIHFGARSLGDSNFQIYESESQFHRDKDYACYYAYEVEQDQKPCFKNHIWNLGAILFEIATGQQIKYQMGLPGNSHAEKTIEQLPSGHVHGLKEAAENFFKNTYFSNDIVNFIMSCLDKDINQRPSIEELMNTDIYKRVKESHLFVLQMQEKMRLIYQSILLQARKFFNKYAVASVVLPKQRKIKMGSSYLLLESANPNSFDGMVQKMLELDNKSSTLSISRVLRSHFIYTIIHEKEFYEYILFNKSQVKREDQLDLSSMTEEEQLNLAIEISLDSMQEEITTLDKPRHEESITSDVTKSVDEMTEEEQLELALRMSLIDSSD